MKNKSLLLLTLYASACTLLTACASSSESQEGQIISINQHTVSKSIYNITIQATDADLAKENIDTQALSLIKTNNCQSYTIDNIDTSITKEVIHPEMAATLAEQAPRFGWSFYDQEKRVIAIEAATPVPVYTYTAKVSLINCKTK
jgi:azurin